MPQYTIQPQDVKPRVGNKKDGSGTFTVYEMFDEFGNKWQTFKQPLANEATRFIGQTADIQGRIEQNGQYENRYFDDIRLSSYSSQPQTQQQPIAQAQPNPAVQAQQAQAQQPRQNAAAYNPPQQSAPNPKPIPWSPDEKDWNIMRQCACKVSAVLSQNESEFWANLDPLVIYMASGLIPQSHNTALTGGFTPPALNQGNQANQFIPQQDPGSDWGTNPPDDSDIPFMPTLGEFGI